MVKRIHTVDGITFVRFDDRIVKELGLNSGELWAEQRVCPEGVLLIIRKRSNT